MLVDIKVMSDTKESNYDRKTELIAFDDTKAGVKGLVDSGIKEVPHIFIHPSHLQDQLTSSNNNHLSFPVIDLDGIHSKDTILRNEIVDKIMDASVSWGFFQVINHGIPVEILNEMINGYYYINMAPKRPNPEELPEVCRDILMEYSEQILKVGKTLFELLSEGLGLNPNHLADIGCTDGLALLGHYYPACPQPELTMGTTKHTDNAFLTLLLQDNLGGLQVLYEDKYWVDVPPNPESLVVNVGDLLQARSVLSSKSFGPIKELLSEENKPKYTSINIGRISRGHVIK
ncbi:hypothetical protein Leryth_027527 [Lithospermum erythrorhizon]|nr:hypothetical protein Leryth_027527 [Lithospermum erythrorhizon]